MSQQTVNVASTIITVVAIAAVVLWAWFANTGEQPQAPADKPAADKPAGGDPAGADPAVVPAGYTDAATIPAYKSVADMGEDHPRIFLGGHRLDYATKRKLYFFAGTDVPAAWIEYQAEAGKPPVRELAFPSKVESGTWWRFNGREWVKD